MAGEVAIELHHGGFLSKSLPYKYEGGTVDIIIDVDPDRMSYWELIELVAELGYPSTSEIYFKLPNRRIDDGLVLIEDDRQVVEIIEAYNGIKMWVMYVEAGIGPINVNELSENNEGRLNNPNAKDDDGQYDGDDNEENDANDDGDNAHLGEEGSDDGEEGTVSGPEEDGNSLNSEQLMKNMTLKPWMLEGLEGVGDDDIFAPRQKLGTDLVELVASVDDAECGSDTMEVAATSTEAYEKALTIIDFVNDEKDQFGEASDNGEDGDEKWPKFCEERDMENPNLVVGMRFKNAKIFRDAVVEWNVRRWCDIKWIRNESKRMLAKCRREGCKWRIFASPMQGKSTLQVKTFNPEHTCQPRFENSLVTSTYLSKRYFNLLSDNPNWKIKSMKKMVRRECKVDVGDMKLYRAKRKAIEMNEGDVGGQYNKLGDYIATITKHNPGSTCIMLLTSPKTGQLPHFKRFYVCIEALRKGFSAGCRRIIGLDGCFLKGVFDGQMLSAIGRDGNDNIYPLAWAIVEVENKDSWNWFMGLLVHDIGETRETKWTFMSDRQKGLLDVFKGLLPNADHRYCVKHLYANVTAKYKGLQLQELVWAAAYASTPREFSHCMEKIKTVDGDAYEYLKDLDPKCWSRSHFDPHVKCDILVNNLNESWNSYILEAREMPILQMLESIRRKIMTRVQIKREGMGKYDGSITPRALSILNDNLHESRNCFAHYAGDLKFEVDYYNTTKVVDLASHSCSCRNWDLTGIPCKHGIAAIQQTGQSLELYVNNWFSKALYVKAYSFALAPLPGQSDWECTNESSVLPPYYKKPSGRPKKQRKRQPDEPSAGNKVQKKGGFITCSKCLLAGHNARTCKRAVHKDSRFMKSKTCNKGSHGANTGAAGQSSSRHGFAKQTEVLCTPATPKASEDS